MLKGKIEKSKERYERFFGTNGILKEHALKSSKEARYFPLGLSLIQREGRKPLKLRLKVNVLLLRTLLSLHRKGNVIYAPDPWVAAAYLNLLIGSGITTGKHKYIYRGQGNSKWDVVSSLDRSLDIERDKRAGEIFSAILYNIVPQTSIEMYEDYRVLKPGPESYLALAQHYGIPTKLIDFTTDPSVAIWFADHTNEKDCEASVYLLPLESAKRNGLRITLPPPLGDRLYLQNGLFIQNEKGIDLRKYCTEIRFRPTGKFRLFGKSGEVQNLISTGEADNWLISLAKRSKDMVNLGANFPNGLEDLYKAIDVQHFKRLLPEDPLKWLMDWAFKRLNIIYWIGLRSAKKGIKLDSNVLGSMVSDNIEWAIATVYVLNFIIPDEVGIFRNEKIWSDARHYICNCINEALPAEFRLPPKKKFNQFDKHNGPSRSDDFEILEHFSDD